MSYLPEHSDLKDLTSDDHTQYLLANGTRELSANWVFGATFGIKGLYASLSSIYLAIATQTSATLTLSSAHHTVLCDGTSNTVTINLPTAVGIEGRIYNIKAINIDNAVTVDADGTEEIDGSATAITLALMEVITIQSDGSNWWII